MSDALAIYQDHLDRVSRAVWSLDTDTLLETLALPNRMLTQDAEVLLDTPEALIEAIRDFKDFLLRAGANEYHRIARLAHFHPQHDNRIDGSHDTYILRGGQFVLEPYRCDQVLVRENGGWRGIEIRAEVHNSTCTVLSPTHLRRQRERNLADLDARAAETGKHV